MSIRTGTITQATITAFCVCALFVTGCISSDESQDSIHSITESDEFSISRWEFDSLLNGLWESLKPASRNDIDDVETVKKYFASVRSESGLSESEREELEDKVERILSKQIREALIEVRIINPLDNFVPLRVVFPPIHFEFESPPSLLVVSPRDEIRLLRRTTLKPELSTEEKESLESRVDALGYSSLVVRLGGVGFTYPTMVIESSNLRRTIDRIAEEWFHQYMFFHPLGFLYALDGVGWRSDYDIIVMNETVAGIVSKEIGSKVYFKYYSEQSEEPDPPREPVSEFDREMRQIRIQVDQYLSEGKVVEAEEFMRERRDFLATKGYHIRKLNQAYFAFYGTYADDPSTVNPIGQNIQELRRQSESLHEFLGEVRIMTGPDDLEEALEETSP